MDTHSHFMRRCFQLAQNGKGTTYPNPLVGAVIVHRGHVIGEGWHRKAGEPHAEVMAVQSVRDKSLLKDSTLYVNLEPCSFHGRTPACSTMIIREKIPRVVISTLDPNPKVSGAGIEMLREAGVEVVPGVLEKEGKELNRIFFTNQIKRRPYVILKWAQTSDGFIAGENGKKVLISNIWSRQLTHKWRSENQAVLIGKNTLIHDNPRLDARLWNGRRPVPVILGYSDSIFTSNLYKIHEKIFIVDHAKKVSDKKLHFIRVRELEEMLQALYENDITIVFVEGGSNVLNQFLNKGLWDELRVFTANKRLIKGLKAPALPARIRQIGCEKIAGDILNYYAHPENDLINEGRYL